MQDVHLENKMEDYVKHDWGYDLYLSGLSSNKRGVMTLINNNFEQEVDKVIRDANGNYILTQTRNVRLTFVSVNSKRMQAFHSNVLLQ